LIRLVTRFSGGSGVRYLVRWVTVSVALALAAGCGGDGGTGPEPGNGVTLDAAQAVTARIGAAGGQLRTTDSHGRIYLLDIPAQALQDSVDISLTPVARYEMPSGATLVAAAQFAPEGLQLAVPGRLAIVVPGGAPTVAGFGYSGQGEDLHLDLLGRHGDTLFIPVRHFSGSGGATVTDVDLLTPSLPSGAAVQAYIDVATLSQQGAAAGAYDVQAIADALIAWATNVVTPALQSASTDQQLLDAMARFNDWIMVITCGASGCEGGSLHLWPDPVWIDVVSLTLGTYDQLRLDAARAVKAGIDRLNARCIANHDIQAAANTIFWEKLAVLQGLDYPAMGLDFASFDSHFCLAATIQAVTLPTTLTAGAPAELQVKAGISFGGGAPEYEYPLLVTVSVSNAAPAEVSGYTTDGIYRATLTPTGESPLFLGIRAAVRQEGLDVDQNIYRDTTYEQAYGHIAITPTAAILDPGATAQFTATVTGLSSSAVTWTATGGTLSTTSGTSTTYTAGGTAGTFSVTATSVTDPTQRASARVDILAGGVMVVVSPASVTLAPGGVQQFTATVTGTADHSVSWSALGGTAVVAGNTLTYTAGNNPGVYAVSATSIADPSAGAAAQVSIGFQPGDVYAGTLTYQAWPFPVPGQEAGVTKPFAFILSAAQNTWVTCNASGQTITPYSTYCALAGSPFSATTPAAFLNVSLDGIGRLGTTPTGNCYYSGQLQNVTVSGGGVHGTGATGVLYCPANGNYQVYFTFTTVRR
jgi:hypothetical protein